MITMVFRCESISPLLSNNPAGMLKMQARKAKTRGTRYIPPAAEEAEDGTYRLPDGSLYHPTLAFRRCAIDGGKGRKPPGSRSGLNTILAASLFIAGDRLETPLVDPDTGEPLRDYEIDTRRSVPPGQGAVIRARPRLDAWAATVTFELDDDRVDPDLAEWAFRSGGSNVGIGNYRPEKGGVYGRFRVIRL